MKLSQLFPNLIFHDLIILPGAKHHQNKEKLRKTKQSSLTQFSNFWMKSDFDENLHGQKYNYKQHSDNIWGHGNLFLEVL